jgi:hypothetical protein
MWLTNVTRLGASLKTDLAAAADGGVPRPGKALITARTTENIGSTSRLRCRRCNRKRLAVI